MSLSFGVSAGICTDFFFFFFYISGKNTDSLRLLWHNSVIMN